MSSTFSTEPVECSRRIEKEMIESKSVASDSIVVEQENWSVSSTLTSNSSGIASCSNTHSLPNRRRAKRPAPPPPPPPPLSTTSHSPSSSSTTLHTATSSLTHNSHLNAMSHGSTLDRSSSHSLSMVRSSTSGCVSSDCTDRTVNSSANNTLILRRRRSVKNRPAPAPPTLRVSPFLPTPDSPRLSRLLQGTHCPAEHSIGDLSLVRSVAVDWTLTHHLPQPPPEVRRCQSLPSRLFVTQHLQLPHNAMSSVHSLSGAPESSGRTDGSEGGGESDTSDDKLTVKSLPQRDPCTRSTWTTLVLDEVCQKLKDIQVAILKSSGRKEPLFASPSPRLTHCFAARTRHSNSVRRCRRIANLLVHRIPTSSSSCRPASQHFAPFYCHSHHLQSSVRFPRKVRVRSAHYLRKAHPLQSTTGQLVACKESRSSWSSRLNRRSHRHLRASTPSVRRQMDSFIKCGSLLHSDDRVQVLKQRINNAIQRKQFGEALLASNHLSLLVQLPKSSFVWSTNSSDLAR
jgi:hypothetical protein